jgi:peptidoglycan hydrolase-like protein with peptidoglycan-binding domain
MKVIFAALAMTSICAFADDPLRDAQAELKNQGFFYGEVDGKAGAETTAAIRRYQIRNGLQVTGDLSAETVKSLGLGGAKMQSPPPPQQINPPTPEQKKAERKPAPVERQFEREIEPERPVTRPHPEYDDDEAVVPKPRIVPNPVPDDFSTFYHGTPYVNAPLAVQRDVLRKAQTTLSRRGLYRDALDGFPGPSTSDALFLYQERQALPRTGRLDMRTLSDMNLLPGRSPDAPPLKPFYNPNRKRDRSVDMRYLSR